MYHCYTRFKRQLLQFVACLYPACLALCFHWMLLSFTSVIFPQVVYAGEPAHTKNDMSTVLDEPILPQLYDLEKVKYQLRLKQWLSLNDKDKQNIQKPSLPIRPRLNADNDLFLSKKHDVWNGQNAKIKIAFFCHFLGKHCREVAGQLDNLRREFGDLVSIQYFDSVSKYHRGSKQASRYFQCVKSDQFKDVSSIKDSSKLWSWFYQLMMREQFHIKDTQGFNRLWKIPSEATENCIRQVNIDESLTQIQNTMQKLGLKKSPVILVNGLYFPYPVNVNKVTSVINKELQLKPYVGKRSVVLSSTLISEKIYQSTATIRIQGRSVTLGLGDTVENIGKVRAIKHNGVILENNQQLFHLPLNYHEHYAQNATQPVMAPNDHEMGGETQQQVRDSDMHEQQSLENFKSNGKVILKRRWVNEQFDKENDLKEHFQEAEHEVEGYKLMRLTDVEQLEFYQILGLKNNDVLLRVGEEWVHSGNNPLFRIMGHQNQLRIAFIRQGTPHIYDITIEEQ